MPDDQNHPAQTAGQPAPQAEPPQVPTAIIYAIQRYGDLRADGFGLDAADTLATVIKMIRGEIGAAQAGAVQPAANALTDEDAASWIESTGIPCEDPMQAIALVQLGYRIRGTAPKAAE